MKLTHLQQRLKRHCPEGAVRWVAPSGIHLTLHFLGDILTERVEPARAALSAVARNAASPGLTFEVQGLGAFPNLKRPRVIWVGVKDPTSRIALLHQAVNEALAAVGFTPETRPFSPHLTLGRVRRQAGSADAGTLGRIVAESDIGTLGSVPVHEMVLFQSELRPSGAVYTPLQTFNLQRAE